MSLWPNKHIIDFRNSASPKSKAKPAGVAGCEIWGKVGSPAPMDISQLAYVANRQRHAIYGGIHRRAGGSDGLLLAALGQHARRKRPVKRAGQRHHCGIKKSIAKN